MRRFFMFFAAILNTYCAFSQQQSPNLSPSVTIGIFNYLGAKVTLGPSTMHWLEAYFQRKDSLVAKYITGGKRTSAEVKRFDDSLIWRGEILLKKVMTADERIDFENKIAASREVAFPIFKEYLEPDADMNSQFGFAIKLANKLKLNDKQGREVLRSAVELFARTQYAKDNPDSGFFDKPAFESLTLTSILSQSQYNLLLAEKNKTLSERQAKYAWHDLEALAMTKAMNRDTAMKHLTIYYMMRNHINDAFAHDKPRQESYVQSLKAPKELVALKQAQIGDKLKLQKYRW